MTRLGDDMTQSRSLLHAAFAWWMRQRWLVRAPIWLFRARLGFVFGSRLLMVEHTGRKTGARRYVVVEVIGHLRPGTCIVAALPRAQWYRNIQANSSVRVSVGARHLVPATARPLTAAEKPAVLDGYAQRHPRMWAAMGSVFEDILGGPLAEAPIIALELRKQA